MSEDDNKLSPEPEEEIKEPMKERANDESALPLFLRNSSEGDKGNAQDEKDESGE
jgi:hypothetical protein